MAFPQLEARPGARSLAAWGARSKKSSLSEIRDRKGPVSKKELNDHFA